MTPHTHGLTEGGRGGSLRLQQQLLARNEKGARSRVSTRLLAAGQLVMYRSNKLFKLKLSKLKKSSNCCGVRRPVSTGLLAAGCPAWNTRKRRERFHNNAPLEPVNVAVLRRLRCSCACSRCCCWASLEGARPAGGPAPAAGEARGRLCSYCCCTGASGWHCVARSRQRARARTHTHTHVLYVTNVHTTCVT